MASPASSINKLDAPPFPLPVASPLVQTVQGQALEHYHVDGVGNLRALAMFEGNVAWVGGTGGKIAKTDDGGRRWALCPIPEGERLDVRALCLCNPKVLCAMTAGPAKEGLSRVYRTVDGGTHWDLVLCPETESVFFNAMSFWDEEHGIVLSDPVEGRFVLFKTANGGASWEQLAPLEMPVALEGEGAFAASNSCLTVRGKEHVWFGTGGGSYARIFYSSDQGRHWNVAATPMKVDNPSSGIFSLSFLNEHRGIAVGGDYLSQDSHPHSNIVMTVDGGRTWENLNIPALAGRYLSSVTWLSNQRVLVVDGSQGTFHSVAAQGKQGWAVGPNGNCAKF